ncbi:MAG: VanZ family protein [Pseudomonadota bacterium]
MITSLRLLAAFSFWLLSSLLHLKFSLFLVQPLATFWGTIKLKNYAPYFAYLLIFLLLIFLLWLFFKASTKPAFQRIIIYLWIFLLAIISLINLYLLATPLENIHFVQYAIIAILFIWAIRPAYNNDFNSELAIIAKTLFWVTLAGIVDEFMQYLWITASYSKHLDFNDFLLNLMGTIAGLLSYYSFKLISYAESPVFSPDKKYSGYFSPIIWSFWEVRFSIILVSIFISFFYFDYMQLTTNELIKEGGIGIFNQHLSLFFERSPKLLGSWNNAFNGGRYYILSPLEGSLILLLVAFGFYWGIIKAITKL